MKIKLSKIKSSKKGVSVIIGYVLLITFVTVLGILIYNWMKTYVPSDELDCPEGISLFVQDYACSSNELNISLINTGRFSLGGYFIRATTSPTQQIATLDLSRNITENLAKLYPTGVRFGIIGSENSLGPDEEELDKYDLTNLGVIYSVEITPIRWQVEKGKKRLVSCKNVKVKEIIKCN